MSDDVRIQIGQIDDTYIAPAEAALQLYVSLKTINRWANRGSIPSVATLDGQRRFRRSDIVAAMAAMTARGTALAE